MNAPQQSRRCVRALTLIGGESALAALERFGGDSRTTVKRELLRAWEQFDRVEFARRVLAHGDSWQVFKLESLEGVEYMRFSHLQLMSLPGVRDLNALKHHDSLQSLELINCRDLSDVSVVSSLENLKHLSVLNCPLIRDLGSVEALEKLEELIIARLPKLRRLRWPRDSNSLNTIEIDDCSAVESLPTLTQLPNLRKLTLRNLWALKSFELGSGLDKLISLTVLHSPDLRVSEGLFNLTSLRLLELVSVKPLDSLDGLRSLSELRSLRLCNPGSIATRVSELIIKGAQLLPGQNARVRTSWGESYLLSARRAVQIATEIGETGPSESPWRFVDLSPVSGMKNLELLDISGNDEIWDLKPLGELRKMRYLGLGWCRRISDLGALEGLTELRRLSIAFCDQIDDLTPLRFLQELESISVIGIPDHTLSDQLFAVPWFLEDVGVFPYMRFFSAYEDPDYLWEDALVDIDQNAAELISAFARITFTSNFHKLQFDRRLDVQPVNSRQNNVVEETDGEVSIPLYEVFRPSDYGDEVDNIPF